MVKRPREPDEALKQTDKHPRLQEKNHKSNPEPRNLRKGNKEKPGRPEPSSHAASQAQLTQPSPIQLPSQQPQLDHEWSDSETSTCYSKDAAAYDVRRDYEADVIPLAEDNEYWGPVEAAKFIRTRSGLDGNWVGVRPLGEGGNGMAGLWELRDDEGQTVKQMAVKEQPHKKEDWMTFKDVREVPDEIKIMSKLNKAKCHAITRLFNYKRYPHVYKHRMYMEFCPHNDLDRFIKRYSGFRQFLPEAFLWDTFYHLVEAAVAMKSGTGDWEFEIVHRDLKPANVFLGAENAKKGFPFYPVAKLGDFGAGVMTNHEDPANPSRLRNAGTEGYLAPEQVSDNSPKELQYQLSTYTNIWGIGAIMLELLTLYRHADYMVTPEYHFDDGHIIDIKTVRKPEYTQDLRKLIKQCVEPDPLKRIKLKDLRSRIKSRRHEYRKLYRGKSEGERERFRDDHRLYYVGNEINDMPTGNWEPQKVNGSPRSRTEGFDREFPIVYPLFADGPEGEVDHEAALPPKDREGKGHRFSKPILISDDDLVNKSNDSDIWARKERRRPPVRKDESSSDGRRPLDRDLDVARGRGGVRDDDGGSDDGELDMELEVEEPPSPSPPSPEHLVQYKKYASAPATQAELEAVAHAAPLQVQAPTQPPAQAQTQAQAAPQAQTQPPPAPLPPAPAPAPQTALQAVAHAALQQIQAQAAPQVQVQAPSPPPPPPVQVQAPPPPPPAAPSPPPDPKLLRNGKVRGYYA